MMWSIGGFASGAAGRIFLRSIVPAEVRTTVGSKGGACATIDLANGSGIETNPCRLNRLNIVRFSRTCDCTRSMISLGGGIDGNDGNDGMAGIAMIGGGGELRIAARASGFKAPAAASLVRCRVSIHRWKYNHRMIIATKLAAKISSICTHGTTQKNTVSCTDAS